MITLFGATGVTGSLTARALEEAGVPFRIAGRNKVKLETLSSSLKSKPDYQVVDIGYAQDMDRLMDGTAILINCAGPFTDIGERVVRQAAVSGVHYLDSTNELGFVYRMQTYHKLAVAAGAALVPSCAFEVALSDCAAAMLSQKLPGPYTLAETLYHLPGTGISTGTLRSSLRSLATSWLAYTGGHWVGEVPSSRRKYFKVQGKSIVALSIPSCESIALQQHLKIDTIRNWMSVGKMAGWFGPVLIPYAARFLRSIAGPWIQSSIQRGKPRTVNNVPFLIQVTLENQSKRGLALIRGEGPYPVTARLLARAAARMSDPSFSKTGLIAPSAVLCPEDIEGMVASIEFSTEEL